VTVYVYGLTYTDVAAEIPLIDAGSIGAATEPISQADLTTWIEDGAGKLNAGIAKSGLTPSANMDADAHAALVEAVKGYAVHKALAVLGVTGTLYVDARQRWESVYKEYIDRPQNLGTEYTDAYTLELDSDTKAEDWDFIDSEGSQW